MPSDVPNVIACTEMQNEIFRGMISHGRIFDFLIYLRMRIATI